MKLITEQALILCLVTMFIVVLPNVAVSVYLSPEETRGASAQLKQKDNLSVTKAIKSKSRFASQAFFTIRPDLRACPSPHCGGFFVKAVNRRLTTCVDGRWAPECYVANIDWDALGGDLQIQASVVVVEGSLQVVKFEGFGRFGELVVKNAWGSATDNAPRGFYMRLADNGIRCITAPCFSTDAHVLNWRFNFTLSGFDLGGIGATDEQLEQATRAFSAGDLLVSGRFKRRPVISRNEGMVENEVVATQMFLPAAKTQAICATDEECPAGNWCRQTEEGLMACVPFVGEGVSCNGFTLPWFFERCQPGLVCDTPELIADAPGVCRTQCASNLDCNADQYCANDGLCHDDGTCDRSIDCNLEGNDFVHIECVGHGVCPEFGSQCGWQCENPACVDLKGVDFGLCDAVLGWGKIDGQCQVISGCDAEGHKLFSNEKECEAACLDI